MSRQDSNEEKILCETPTPGKKPTRIARWKYEVIRAAILKILPDEPPGISFKELPNLVAEALQEDIKSRLGSVGWYTTTVKLALEVKGEIRRVPGLNPQHLVRVK